jgi:hypothetical protein
MVGERLQDVHGLLAGDREDKLAALCLEALDEEIGGSAASVNVGHRVEV